MKRFVLGILALGLVALVGCSAGQPAAPEAAPDQPASMGMPVPGSDVPEMIVSHGEVNRSASGRVQVTTALGGMGVGPVLDVGGSVDVAIGAVEVAILDATGQVLASDRPELLEYNGVKEFTGHLEFKSPNGGEGTLRIQAVGGTADDVLQIPIHFEANY